MRLRDRFLEVMLNFNTDVSAPKWEFGYWGKTIDNWYEEGLQKKSYPKIPTDVTTPTASLYNPCWHSVKGGKLPAGIAITGGGLYWPTQSFAEDVDVRKTLNMDTGQRLVDVNLLFEPMFEIKILEENERFLTYVDIDGVTRKFSKSTGVLPVGIDWVIKDRQSWEKLKAERLSVKDIRARFPSNWKTLVEEYKNPDLVITLGGYPQGCFGTSAHLMGYEHLFYNYSDQPGLLHDMQKTFTEVWLAVYEEVLSEVQVDMFIFWEDLSAGTGSMISPATIREFMVPYYKRITSFLKAHGVNIIFIDTDGYCADLIPIFLEAGVTGMYPIEVSCGMDLVKVRREFPKLQLMGGIAKSEIQYGKERIDRILQPVAHVLKTGGYVPFGDHLIPPEVHWDHFKYYREKLNGLIDTCSTS